MLLGTLGTCYMHYHYYFYYWPKCTNPKMHGYFLFKIHWYEKFQQQKNKRRNAAFVCAFRTACGCFVVEQMNKDNNNYIQRSTPQHYNVLCILHPHGANDGWVQRADWLIVGYVFRYVLHVLLNNIIVIIIS